ncbi:DUF3750 domain-containing protein [Thalassomonas viridans]|uniref:DUF3750 domain-containing protein n=1 Tax=Thalassomonas viridans TaxID=137584 RepID=A0AAE9YXM4_9GAMM|nr:DUF3750 domain-containing protein [Thalassomonas viridans]WDE03116.1 DUF3750 domain-containing protein [Thalassomonas viridans]
MSRTVERAAARAELSRAELCRVELRAAKIPGPPGLIADHYWFVIVKGAEAGHRQRWEVWQQKNAGGQSWQHLHKNLKAWHSGVGNGPSRVEYCWRGAQAARLIRGLETSPQNYPYLARYRYWPGPNSNTYVQWVLDQAGINMTPGPSAIGKDYLGLLGVKKLKPGLLLSTPVVALAFSREKYLVVQLLTLPFGVFFKPLRFIYPGFRLGNKRTDKE